MSFLQQSCAGSRALVWRGVTTCALCFGLLSAPTVHAKDDALEPVEAAVPRRVPKSSLLTFVEAVAAALEGRARVEKVTGPVRLDVTGARGVDPKKAEREFGARLLRRLRDGNILVPVARADLRARVVVSQEGGHVWAVTVFEGGALPAPSAVAISADIDRELEVAFGAGARPGQSRWVKERLGTAPAGVLDAVLLDVDGDLADDIALLSIDGLRLYRYAPGDSRPELLGGPYALPGDRRWPRVAAGWLAATAEGKLWLATSAGHTAVFDPRGRRFESTPERGVPVRQPSSSLPGEPLLLLGGRFGSPVLTTPALSSTGEALSGVTAPSGVRDLLAYPGREGVWLWVDTDGRLGGHLADQTALLLPTPDRAGDRILVADLDGDGEGELVTSAATPPGDGDEVTIYGIEPSLERLTVLFRAALSGGGIVAMAEGELDFDGYPDVLVVEEGVGKEAVLWRLELAP